MIKTIYASPVEAPEFSEYDGKDGRFSLDRMREVDARYYGQVQAWLKSHGYKHRLAGKLIRLPWADSHAEYMIANGTTLIHMPLGDAWNVPVHMVRGLSAADLTRMSTDPERVNAR